MKLKALRPRVQPAQPVRSGWRKQASADERGYGWQWKQVRARVMARDCGLCQPCSRAGFVRLAGEVDHIVGKDRWRIERGSVQGCDDESNLQAICSPCHKAKTGAERLGGTWDEAKHFAENAGSR